MKRVKRQTTGWLKNFKPLKNSPVINWEKDMNRHYIDKNIQMVNQNMKRCSTSLIIREMQIKLTMRYTYTL